MKIVDKRKPVTIFANINQGECFIDNTGSVFIKTGDDNNAVDLANGTVYSFESDTEVLSVKTSVIIIHDSEG